MQYLTKLLDKTSGVVDWIPLIAAILVFATFQYSERISDVAGAVSIHLRTADLHSSLAVQARLSWGLVLFLYATRSEEHTSELQSQSNLVCRLLLEKKKNTIRT